VNRSANGLALFASAGAGDFQAVQLDAPIEDHWLFIGAVPHIYPLMRLMDQYPRYAAVMLDTNHARIFAFGLGSLEKREDVKGVRTRRTSMGGWSQARYQRHVENVHLHHIKEVVDTLDRIVRADNIQHIIVVGDEVTVPLFKDALGESEATSLVRRARDARATDGCPRAHHRGPRVAPRPRRRRRDSAVPCLEWPVEPRKLVR
jgi:peptide chain release factor subunit 1